MDIEAYISENSALKRKLESKAEALLILSEELTNCKRERDELKHISLTKNFSVKESWSPEKYEYADTDTFHALKEKNKALFIEIRDLRHKLQEAYSDLKVLRAERAAPRTSGLEEASSRLQEELVHEVEESKAQIRELKSDLQALLDEKEDLITERDAYRCKVHRLNHEMANLLKLSSPIDVDAILMENKYTKERLEQALNEIDIVKHTLSKYKENEEQRRIVQPHEDEYTSVYFRSSSEFGMLDKKKMKGSVKLGNTEDLGCRVITHKQVLELLEKEESIWRRGMMNKEATVSDLRGLCMALVDSIQDKSLSLSHQKKANRILAERVKYLEDKLSKHETVNPCHLLLEGYSNSEVDSLPPIKLDEKGKKKKEFENPFKNNCDMGNSERAQTTESLTEDEEKLPQELEDLVNRALQEVDQNAEQ